MTIIRTVVLGLASLVAFMDCSLAADSREELSFALLGQALIQHDPRDYVKAPLASVLPHLSGADVIFTNLEAPVCSPGMNCMPTRNDLYFHGTTPEVLDYLDAIGVNLLSLANNHSWDYGAEGILAGRIETSKRGIVHAGTGRTLAEAVAPAFLEVHGRRIALVAAASAKLKPEAAANDTRPGVNVLLPKDDAAWDRNLQAIRDARARADFVLVYQHFQSIDDPLWQQAWARAAIDNGADLYVAHGAPRLSGVEVRGRGLILYGLGNFIFHTRKEIGGYPADVWESVLVNASWSKDGWTRCEFVPLLLNEGKAGPDMLKTRGLPEVATGDHGKNILDRLATLSQPFGTKLAIRGGRAQLVLPKLK